MGMKLRFAVLTWTTASIELEAANSKCGFKSRLSARFAFEGLFFSFETFATGTEAKGGGGMAFSATKSVKRAAPVKPAKRLRVKVLKKCMEIQHKYSVLPKQHKNGKNDEPEMQIKFNENPNAC